MKKQVAEKRALIVFPDEWLQYSPYILNLEQCMREEGYIVNVVYGDNGLFDNMGLVQHARCVRLIQRGILAKALRILKWYPLYKRLSFFVAMLLVWLERKTYDQVFAVDVMGYAVTRPFFKDAIFVSLELHAQGDLFVKYFNRNPPESLIIQTPERADYLLKDVYKSPERISYIQNAPIIEETPEFHGRRKKEILYLGNVDREYAMEPFLEAFRSLSEEYSLVIKGFGINKSYIQELQATYEDLFETDRARFIEEYIQQEDIIDFVSQFYIGLVGYDTILVQEDYNYQSCPSGKLFNYYAGGVPVIGLNIEGLQSVNSFETGILLNTISVPTFIAAINQIEARYDSYVVRCFEAAEHYDFRKGVHQFLKPHKEEELRYA